MFLVGISGESGSGKSTFARMLSERLAGSYLATLNSLIKDELVRLGLEPNKKSEHFIGRYRRAAVGNSYWIDRAIATLGDAHKVVILASIFDPDEALLVERSGGVVIWIEAPLQERYRRRGDDKFYGSAVGQSAAYFDQLKAERGERVRSEVEASLKAIRDRAAITVENATTLESLEATADEVARKLAALYRRSSPNISKLLKLESDPSADAALVNDEFDSIFSLAKVHYFEERLFDLISKKRSTSACESERRSLQQLFLSFFNPDFLSVTGAETAKKLATVFLHTDPREALAAFRSFKPSNPDEEYLSGITDADFFDIHAVVHLTWQDQVDKAVEECKALARTAKANDRQQFRASGSAKHRSIERLRRVGVTFSLPPEHFGSLFTDHVLASSSTRPILEHVKNERVFSVSGFEGSKVSVVVHDVIDHMWTFDFLERQGLFEKYSRLFEAIGNPEKSDIFRREGEIVAAISYAVRAFASIAPGFQSIFNIKAVLKQVREWRGNLNETHTDALRIINNIDSDSLEWRSLGFCFSNYLTELDVQRRTQGTIKYRDPDTHRLLGELDPFSPDYLCFFIEAHHLLLDPRNGHRSALFYTHYLLEEYLRIAASGETVPGELALTPSRLNGEKLHEHDLIPYGVAEWMQRNYWFTVTRSAL